jgi:NAD(P)-dependent dehydrogenase (short-subunit alcohol dehydrogenase family)
MVSFGLEGKLAIVSGAGSIPGRAGHGRQSALKLAEAGATVACIDIDRDRANAIVAEIKDAGGQAFPVLADMTIREEALRAVDEATSEGSGIGAAVDIIGRATYALGPDAGQEDWNWALSYNLTQVFYFFQAVSKHMITQRNPGSIVALASVDGIGSSRYHAAYGAAKAGVISIVKTFADELGPYGIRVNAVAPGNVGNGNEDQPPDQFGVDPLNPLAPPRGSDVGNAVLFLSSGLAARITGQTIVVDGGVLARSPWGWTPDILDELQARY